MRKLALAAWLATVLLLGVSVGSALAAGPIVLGDDDGGFVSDHVKFYERIRASGVPVRIEGICISACTLVLMLPYSQVCVTPRMSFGFHQASSGDKVRPDLTEVLQRRYYPPVIQAWIAEWVGRNGPLTRERITYMPAADVIRLNVFPACEE